MSYNISLVLTSSEKQRPSAFSAWGANEIAKWLTEDLEYEHYVPLFEQNKITGDSLFSLEAKDLAQMGIWEALHMQRILCSIKDIRESFDGYDASPCPSRLYHSRVTRRSRISQEMDRLSRQMVNDIAKTHAQIDRLFQLFEED